MKTTGFPLFLAYPSDSIYAVTMPAVVIDTNVVVSALRSGGGASRRVIRLVLQGRIQPLFGNALWAEYCELFHRDVWGDETSPSERRDVLTALASVGRWVRVYFAWRPNLPDEADNHLMELAVAGGAVAIITHNLRDLGYGELRFDGIEILTPSAFLKQNFGGEQ